MVGTSNKSVPEMANMYIYIYAYVYIYIYIYVYYNVLM